jgi:hypothetical protein
MTNKNYTEAYDAAQQEHQNKEKEFVKQLVLELLQKVEAKQKEKNKIEDDIQVLRKQLDYLKEGRLDKISDMQALVPTSTTLCPWTVTTINDGSTGTIPGNGYSLTYGSTSLNGRIIKQWFGGAYKVGDKIIYF